MQLALRRMAEKGGRHLQSLERILHVPQENGHRGQRNSDVFDAGRGSRTALHAKERGNESLGQPPIQLEVDFILGQMRRGGEAQFILHQLDDFIQLSPQLLAAVGMMFDKQYGLGFAGD